MYFYVIAESEVKFTNFERFINVAASSLAIAFGMVHMISYLQPRAPTIAADCVYPSTDPVCNSSVSNSPTTQPTNGTMNLIYKLPLESNPIL